MFGKLNVGDSIIKKVNSDSISFHTNDGILIDDYNEFKRKKYLKTLKYEYGLKQTVKNLHIATKITKKAVFAYNNLRTHFSLNLNKLSQVHLNPEIHYKSYRKNKLNLNLLTI